MNQLITLGSNPLAPTFAEGITGILFLAAIVVVSALALGFVLWLFRGPGHSRRAAPSSDRSTSEETTTGEQ